MQPKPQNASMSFHIRLEPPSRSRFGTWSSREKDEIEAMTAPKEVAEKKAVEKKEAEGKEKLRHYAEKAK